MMSLKPLTRSVSAIKEVATPLAQGSLELAQDTLWVLEKLDTKRDKRAPHYKDDTNDIRVSFVPFPPGSSAVELTFHNSSWCMGN